MATQPNRDLTLNWHKSSASGGSGECVEVAQWRSSVLVRDSGDHSGPILTFSLAQWCGLVRRIKDDRPLPGHHAR
jgi:hypothetical protein